MKVNRSGPAQHCDVTFYSASLVTLAQLRTIYATAPLASHAFYMDAVVPTTCTIIQDGMNTGSAANADMQIAQMALCNKTALGLP